MSRRCVLSLIALLIFSGTLFAASSHDCGSYFLRYRVVASHTLSAESANMLGVKSNPNVGVINIILLSKAAYKPLKGQVHVIVKRSSGLIRSLNLRTIESEEATLFYAAEFDFSEGEKLDFELSVSALGEPPQRLSFSKTLP